MAVCQLPQEAAESFFRLQNYELPIPDFIRGKLRGLVLGKSLILIVRLTFRFGWFNSQTLMALR